MLCCSERVTERVRPAGGVEDARVSPTPGRPADAGDAVAIERRALVRQHDLDLAAEVEHRLEEDQIATAGRRGVADPGVELRSSCWRIDAATMGSRALGKRGWGRPGRSTMWPTKTATFGMPKQASSRCDRGRGARAGSGRSVGSRRGRAGGWHRSRRPRGTGLRPRPGRPAPARPRRASPADSSAPGRPGARGWSSVEALGAGLRGASSVAASTRSRSRAHVAALMPVQ